MRSIVPAVSPVTPDPFLFRGPAAVKVGVQLRQRSRQPRPLLSFDAAAPVSRSGYPGANG
jgi:hypothetical protein